MSIKRMPLPVIYALLLCACEQTIQESPVPVNFSFSSPKPSWRYYSGEQIMLALNVNTQDIRWDSSLDGHLGDGNHLLVYLSDGEHTIHATVMGTTKSMEPPQADSLNVAELHHTPIRDIQLPIPRATPPLSPQAPRRQGRDVPDTRNFWVVNTAEQYAAPHEVNASLLQVTNALTVWAAASSDIEDDALNRCIQAVEAVILPRVGMLWGTAADIDGDGRLAILISPTINDEKAAVGFFNPGDFFARNTDETNASYNPASNEMDIIYIAVPDDTTSSYSTESIIATIAHELTHAVTFTRKTWQRLQNGEQDAPREELFLDEGWSHLSENLCGYGVSGGNSEFFRRFLAATADYSFCAQNVFGQEDSAGLRGAMTLFLSWLFWQKGGMIYDSHDPVRLIDCGGIRFLKNMINSSDTGWESIGKAYGTRNTDALFSKMVSEINRQRMTNVPYLSQTDLLTGELIDFFVNMTLPAFPEALICAKIYTYTDLSVKTIGAYSFALCDVLPVGTENSVIINATKYGGTVFYVLSAE